MCGLAGYIGDSKKPDLTYQLITKLFEKNENRGIDAAGFWGVDTSGSVLYHKEPGRSSFFINKEIWQNISQYKPNLLLTHARGTSAGVGDSYTNSNNHPFTNSNRSIALIHNGRIDNLEYQTLKHKYELKTHCDSEILLRIFEAAELYSSKELNGLDRRLAGIKDIFSLINEGHMAVAVGERQNDARFLWLFRNNYRPLWIVDMRKLLGQIFFVSEPSIWEEALNECDNIKGIVQTQKMMELPPEEIWRFKYTKEGHSVDQFKIYKDESHPWVNDGKKIVLPSHPTDFEIITKLDENDCVLRSENLWEEVPLRAVDDKCDEIIQLVNIIRDTYKGLVQLKSIEKQDAADFFQNLEQQHLSLEELCGMLNQQPNL